MKEIRNWKVKRSGSAMTIEGSTIDGVEVTVANIVSIEAGDGPAKATGHDGQTYNLGSIVVPAQAENESREA